MKKLYYIILLFFIASCNDMCNDSDVFNGEIYTIEDNVPQQEVTFQEYELNKPFLGYFAVRDSLVCVMNPRLPSNWYQVLNVNTPDDAINFVGKGNGHKEFSAVCPIFNFYTENNDTKGVLFDANKEQLSIWNITRSLSDASTVIEKQIRFPWRRENRGACFNELFIKDSCTIYAKVSAIPLGEHDASLPYYQIRDLRDGKKTSEIHLFKKSIVNKQTKHKPETFFYSHDAMKPDGSKIAQIMLFVPQLNIIDTESGNAIAYHLNDGMRLVDLQNCDEFKPYFTCICADDNYIYAAFYGKNEWGINDIPCINNIYIFDWNGKLRKKIITKHSIDKIAVDNVTKVLYTSSPADEKLYYIDTSKLTEDSLNSNFDR